MKECREKMKKWWDYVLWLHTPCTCEASVASRVVSAPVLLSLSSNHAISCKKITNNFLVCSVMKGCTKYAKLITNQTKKSNTYKLNCSISHWFTSIINFKHILFCFSLHRLKGRTCRIIARKVKSRTRTVRFSPDTAKKYPFKTKENHRIKKQLLNNVTPRT